MITKSDWLTVREQLMNEERRSLGAPPTADELLAYRRGELDEAETERMRELLVAYPEFARALVEPFPAEDAKPGEVGYVSPGEIDRQWERLQERIGLPKGAPVVAAADRRVTFWRVFAAVAATLAILVTGWSLQLARRLEQPQLVTLGFPLLEDEHWRGSAPAPRTILPNRPEAYALIVPLKAENPFVEYRLEIVDVASGRKLWTTSAVQPRTDDTFSIVVPGRFLQSGRDYQVVLYGSNGKGEVRLATSTVTVEK